MESQRMCCPLFHAPDLPQARSAQCPTVHLVVTWPVVLRPWNVRAWLAGSTNCSNFIRGDETQLAVASGAVMSTANTKAKPILLWL